MLWLLLSGVTQAVWGFGNREFGPGAGHLLEVWVMALSAGVALPLAPCTCAVSGASQWGVAPHLAAKTTRRVLLWACREVAGPGCGVWCWSQFNLPLVLACIRLACVLV